MPPDFLQFIASCLASPKDVWVQGYNYAPTRCHRVHCAMCQLTWIERKLDRLGNGRAVGYLELIPEIRWVAGIQSSNSNWKALA